MSSSIRPTARATSSSTWRDRSSARALSSSMGAQRTRPRGFGKPRAKRPASSHGPAPARVIQFAAPLGRRGHALLLGRSTLEYQAVALPDELVIAVIDSGEHRSLADTPYNERRREAEAGNPKRMRHVESEIARVHAFVDGLKERRYERLGVLLKESHASLRDYFEVSTPTVDALVEQAWGIDGCLGARIMAAGFGGSILALIERGRETSFAEAMKREVIYCATADGAFTHQEKAL